MNKGFTPIIIIFYLLGILILLIYYFNNLKKEQVFQEKPNFPENSILPEKLEPQTSLSKDCKNSFDCLISASKTCEPAQAKITHKLAVFEKEATISAFLEIKKRENEDCLILLKIEKIDFSEKLPFEKQKLEGKEIKCKFKIDETVNLFERWKSGYFNLKDFPINKCTGSIFEF